MSPSLQVDVGAGTLRPGDTVSGTVRVVEGGRSRSLSVSLEYVEETEDCTYPARTVTGDPLHSGDLVTGTSFSFELDLPADALPDYRSKHGALSWQVHVRSDEFGSDTHVRRAVPVAPSRQD